jgi:hypothetical protein
MRGSTALLLTLGALTLLTLPTPAVAESEDPAEVPRPRRYRSAEVLLDMTDTVRSAREPGGQFRIRKRVGFEYSHSFASDQGPPVIFSIQGPVMGKKKLGLMFEIRF